MFMAKCYLCNNEANGKYCYYCQRPICDEHATWKGASRFPYCSLCDAEFYKPLIDFCKRLEEYAQRKNIEKKNYLLKSVIEKVIDHFCKEE